MNVIEYHATSVVLEDAGLMIAGPSGIGKSDLALRLIDSGATLISDDITICKKIGNELKLFAPKKTRGLLEVREIGIINVPYVENVRLLSIVILNMNNLERMPNERFKTIKGIKVPIFGLHGNHPSAVIKIKVKLNEFKKII
ncbi:MAG: aldolase [Rickettsiales bacterium]|nr:aldolase [Rickettsiales bacterium]|tara:strand:+ start:2386 stop:2811 length:426 start_codon:yes stop_codon:yes gene_type:complete